MREKQLFIRIEKSQKQELEAAAAQRGTTVGALVRRAVSNLLRGSKSPGPPRLRTSTAVQAFAREREIAWLAANRNALRQFRGQYVVVEGGALIAHSSDLKSAVAEARSKGVHVPFVERISDRDDPFEFWMGP